MDEIKFWNQYLFNRDDKMFFHFGFREEFIRKYFNHLLGSNERKKYLDDLKIHFLERKSNVNPTGFTKFVDSLNRMPRISPERYYSDLTKEYITEFRDNDNKRKYAIERKYISQMGLVVRFMKKNLNLFKNRSCFFCSCFVCYCLTGEVKEAMSIRSKADSKKIPECIIDFKKTVISILSSMTDEELIKFAEKKWTKSEIDKPKKS
jgi:hypothetical protein